MTCHSFKVQKTATYCVLGDITTASYVWFVFHGYGQLARYFIKHFEALDLSRHAVVAPEALSRFYINGTSGRVGASWMTREERLVEIADQLQYVNQLQAALLANASKVKQVIGLGFSQGVATLSRCIAQGALKPQVAIFWAGVFPPDLEPITATHAFDQIRCISCFSTADPYYSRPEFERAQAHFKAVGVQPEIVEYQGGHTLVPQVLRSITERYILH